MWNCGASADTSHRYFPEIVGSTERIVTWLRLDWKIYVEFNNEIINYIFIDYKSILTSTLIPATTKVFSDGFSLGVNLKNSLLPLYHLMEYKLSPSRSYWHSSTTFCPFLTELGTKTRMSLKVIPISATKKYYKQTILNFHKNIFPKFNQQYFPWKLSGRKLCSSQKCFIWFISESCGLGFARLHATNNLINLIDCANFLKLLPQATMWLLML